MIGIYETDLKADLVMALSYKAIMFALGFAVTIFERNLAEHAE